MNPNEDFESLRQKYDELLQQYREVIGEQLSVEARHVINKLDAARDWVLPEAVAQAIGISVQRADFLLGRLVQSGHAEACAFLPITYRITQKGRMAVHGTSA